MTKEPKPENVSSDSTDSPGLILTAKERIADLFRADDSVEIFGASEIHRWRNKTDLKKLNRNGWRFW